MNKTDLLLSIKEGSHTQFEFNKEDEKVKCKCGHNAVWWNTGYLCGTITAYPCDFVRSKTIS